MKKLGLILIAVLMIAFTGLSQDTAIDENVNPEYSFAVDYVDGLASNTQKLRLYPNLNEDKDYILSDVKLRTLDDSSELEYTLVNPTFSLITVPETETNLQISKQDNGSYVLAIPLNDLESPNKILQLIEKLE